MTDTYWLTKITLASAVGAVAVLMACSASNQPGADDPLLSELSSLAGPSARQCGKVGLGQDPSAAWQCAESADSIGASYWFAMQRQGIDSDVWQGAILTGSGKRYIVSYDSNYMGGPGFNPRFSKEPCFGRITLNPSSQPPLQCSRSTIQQ